jgi:rubrerythrin
VAIPEVKLRFEVRSTAENLQEAISGESLEVSRTYPEFMAVANHDRDQKALEYFNHAYKAEIKHKKLFENALTALLAQVTRDLPGEYYVCKVCGNTCDSRLP